MKSKHSPSLALSALMLLSLVYSACGKSPLQNLSRSAIINGLEAQFDVKKSTLALESVEGASFCSGTLIASNLVLTAAHCISGKDLSSFRLRLSDGTLRVPTELQTFKEEQKYGVNFDVAWVKFEGQLPGGFAPAPILRDEKGLEGAVTLAGYGQTATRCEESDPTCQPGTLLEATSRISEYLNQGRWFHLILANSGDRSGPCLGDSGGPMYIKIRGKTFLAGSFVGWDRRLVAEDPLTLCDQGQGIYSYAGAYYQWIEDSSGITLPKGSPLSIWDSPTRDPALESPQTFKDWCESRDASTEAWYTTQRLISLAGDYALENGLDIRKNFTDCAAAEANLRAKIRADGGLDLSAFAPQSFGEQARVTDLAPLAALQNFDLTRLSLIGHAVKDLSPLQSLRSLKMLEIVDNAASDSISNPLDIATLSKLETLNLRNSPGVLRYQSLVAGKGLRFLDINGDTLPLESIAWNKLQLRRLKLENIQTLNDNKMILDLPKLQDLLIRAPLRIELPSTLEGLITLELKGLEDFNLPLEMPKLRNLTIESSHLAASADDAIRLNSVTALETLRFVANTGVDAMTLPPKVLKLRTVTIASSSLRFIDSFVNMPKLKEVDLSGNRLETVPYFQDVNLLTNVDLSANLLRDLDGLQHLSGLQDLDISENPTTHFSALAGSGIVRLKMEKMQEGNLDTVDGLPNLPNLEELRVGRNSFRSVKDFLRFSKLEVLVLSQNQIQDISNLSALKYLVYLELVDNPLSVQECPLRNAKYCRFEWGNTGQ